MTQQEYLDRLRAIGNDLSKDPESARRFLKGLGLFKKRRIISGEERKQVLTMLQLIGPGEYSNNQHVWTESWRVGNIEYNIHTSEDFEELEEVIDEDDIQPY